MFERVEFLLRTQVAFKAGDPVRKEDAARFIHAIDAMLIDGEAKLDKLLKLNRQRVSVAEEYKLFNRARLIRDFYATTLADTHPFAASYEIAINLAELSESENSGKVDPAYKKLFGRLQQLGVDMPSQVTVRKLLPKGRFRSNRVLPNRC